MRDGPKLDIERPTGTRELWAGTIMRSNRVQIEVKDIASSIAMSRFKSSKKALLRRMLRAPGFARRNAVHVPRCGVPMVTNLRTRWLPQTVPQVWKSGHCAFDLRRRWISVGTDGGCDAVNKRHPSSKWNVWLPGGIGQAQSRRQVSAENPVSAADTRSGGVIPG